MTVCRYYLQGTCRFGNRCRFEHIDPDYSSNSYNSSNYSNKRNDYGYQDRYRTQENYQDRSNKYENPELSFGPRRNNYEKSNQNYRSETYNQYENYDSNSKYGQSNRNYSYDRNYSKDDYGRYPSNQRYSSPETHSSNSDRYESGYQKSNFKPSNYSNKYDKNQYEWVSDNYRKQQQEKEKLHYETASYQGDSNDSFSFKDSYGDDKDEDIDTENMIIAERVKEDVTAWELGNQWPFTCYCPFPKKGQFPGFRDISFEELRYEALKAEENNSFDNFVENIAKAIKDVQNNRNKLKQPTEDILSIIQKLRSGEYLNESAATTDGFPVLSFAQNVTEDIADEIPQSSQNAMSSSAFSFRDASAKSSSSFSFKTTLDQGPSSSSFSFKVPQTNTFPSGIPSSHDTDSAFPTYTPLDRLSDQDREQFAASTFTLGKIPTVPPPKVLCF